MKKSKFIEAQIIYAIRQVKGGDRVVDVCRKLGINTATFHKLEKKYGGMGVSDLKKLNRLEEENRKLKQLVADLSLDKHMLQEVIKKKAIKSVQRRELAVLYQGRI